MISENYIRTLLVQNPKINIIDFAKQYNLLTKNIDVSFIDKFLSMVESDDFCIHHDMLYMYGISSLTGGSGDVRKFINQNEFIEDEDYRLRKVSDPVPQGGYVTRNEYYFHPRAFKM